jgi:hypothetical protein
MKTISETDRFGFATHFLAPESPLDRTVIRALISARVESEAEWDRLGVDRIAVRGHSDEPDDLRGPVSESGEVPVLFEVEAPEGGRERAGVLLGTTWLKGFARLRLDRGSAPGQPGFDWDRVGLHWEFRLAGETWETAGRGTERDRLMQAVRDQS